MAGMGLGEAENETGYPQLLRKFVTVRVPATTANLGCGFDSLGMALDIWNELTVEVAPNQEVIVHGEGAGELPTDDTNLVVVGMKAAFKVLQRCGGPPQKREQFEKSEDQGRDSACGSEDDDASNVVPGNSSRSGSFSTKSSRGADSRSARKPMLLQNVCEALHNRHDLLDVNLPPFRYICENRIPFACGLGSSSAAVVAGLVAGLVLAGIELPTADEEALVNLACAIEGHPDNVAPAIYGGLQLGVQFWPSHASACDGVQSNSMPRWLTSPVALPVGLQCILFLPDCTLETSAARAILPPFVSRSDAVFNSSRCALLINCFATGRLSNLRIAMQDKLHQPQRAESHVRHLYPLIDAAVAAGAHCACLSGAGPAVLALTSGARGDIFTQRQGERMDNAVAAAMLDAGQKAGMTGRIFITVPSLQGAHIVSADPPFSEGKVCHFGGGKHI